MKPKSVDVTINTPTEEHYHTFEGTFQGLDDLASVCAENVPDWSSMVFVFIRPENERD